MDHPLQARLEELATALLRRRWASRAAVLNESGEVVALCTQATVIPSPAVSSNALPISEFARDSATAEQPSSDGERRGSLLDESATPNLTARISVEVVDEQRWIYADLGVLRLMARFARSAPAAPATAWLAAELRRIGVSVDEGPAARG